MGNTSIAIQFQSLYDLYTEDEKEDEIQKYIKLADEPGIPSSGRLRRALRRALATVKKTKDEEDDEITDMRGGTEQRNLNITLDRIQLAINTQFKKTLTTENTTQ